MTVRRNQTASNPREGVLQNLKKEISTDMVRMANCHAGVLDSNPGRSKRFSPCHYFTGGSGNSVAPESISGNSSVYTLAVVVDAHLSGNKRGKSVVTVPFLTALLSTGSTQEDPSLYN